MPKSELDKANKDKEHYPATFQVRSTPTHMHPHTHTHMHTHTHTHTYSQIHIVLSEVGSDHLNNDAEMDSGVSESEESDENLSDTDEVDEWETQAV